MVHLEITEVGREPKAPEDSPNLLQTWYAMLCIANTTRKSEYAPRRR
jgi:hypothetical protein